MARRPSRNSSSRTMDCPMSAAGISVRFQMILLVRSLSRRVIGIAFSFGICTATAVLTREMSTASSFARALLISRSSSCPGIRRSIRTIRKTSPGSGALCCAGTERIDTSPMSTGKMVMPGPLILNLKASRNSSREAKGRYPRARAQQPCCSMLERRPLTGGES